MAVLSDKVDFRAGVISWDKEDHGVRTTGWIQQQHIYLTKELQNTQYKNSYNGKKKQTSPQLYSEILLSVINKISRQKIIKAVEGLTDIIDLIGLMIYKTLNTRETTSFLRAHNTFTKIDHILIHLKKPQQIWTIKSI